MALTLPVAMPKKVRPPSELLAKLAKALHVSTDELLGLEPSRSANGHEARAARRLWSRFRQVKALPEKDRRVVIRLVNSLVETKGREASGGSR